MTSPNLNFGEFTGTPEGDRLSTLAAGYRMTFREKILWSEKAQELTEHFEASNKEQLIRAMRLWCDSDSPESQIER